MAEAWERQSDRQWRTSEPVSRDLVARLAPAPGDVVLELAAGIGQTGLLLAEAVAPGGRIVDRLRPGHGGRGAQARRAHRCRERRAPGHGRPGDRPARQERGRRRLPLGADALRRPDAGAHRDPARAAPRRPLRLRGLGHRGREPVGKRRRPSAGRGRRHAGAGPRGAWDVHTRRARPAGGGSSPRPASARSPWARCRITFEYADFGEYWALLLELGGGVSHTRWPDSTPAEVSRLASRDRASRRAVPTGLDRVFPRRCLNAVGTRVGSG